MTTTRSGGSTDIVVFSVLNASVCSGCEAAIERGDLLRIEKEQPLCLGCADLDHLVYLPAGDPALSRRSRKHSTLSAVVVRFSRARKRYERQGLLVEASALERAEQECLNDEEQRLRARSRAALCSRARGCPVRRSVPAADSRGVSSVPNSGGGSDRWTRLPQAQWSRRPIGCGTQLRRRRDHPGDNRARATSPFAVRHAPCSRVGAR